MQTAWTHIKRKLAYNNVVYITVLNFNPAIGSVPVSSALFGEGYNRSIFLDQLTCTGNESSLLECLAQDEVGYHNCDHSEDAGVRCEGEVKKCEQ